MITLGRTAEPVGATTVCQREPTDTSRHARVDVDGRSTTTAEPTSKTRIPEDIRFAVENLIPFNNVQAELCRMVAELTWSTVDRSFFRRSRRDKLTGKPRQDVDVFAGCMPCKAMLGCPADSEDLVPTFAIPADPGSEWHQLHHQPGKITAEERTRWLSRLAGAIAERVNRTPCRCAGDQRR